MTTHPLHPGTRVHHRGGIYSRGWSPEEQAAQPGSYWGTIEDVMRDDAGEPRRYPDGSYEYRVLRDAPLLAGGSLVGEWASYHTDEARS